MTSLNSCACFFEIPNSRFYKTPDEYENNLRVICRNHVQFCGLTMGFLAATATIAVALFAIESSAAAIATGLAIPVFFSVILVVGTTFDIFEAIRNIVMLAIVKNNSALPATPV